MRIRLLFVLPALLWALPAEATDTPARPAFQLLRQDEDWSRLRQATGEPDPFDGIKYVPLDESRGIWTGFGAQVRERVEIWDGFNFGAPAGTDTDDVFLLSRIHAYADLHLGSHLRLFAQGRSSLSTKTDLAARNRKSDIDELDLQNGFAELDFDAGDVAMRLRGGREELLFGRQRLVGPSDWSNTRRQYDGTTLRLAHGKIGATGFWAQPVVIQKNDFNRQRNQFYGLYSTVGQLGRHNLDLYWLGLGRDGVTFNGTTGHEGRQTLGSRAFGSFGPPESWYYDAEAAYQVGELGNADINAFMAATLLGLKTRLVANPAFEVGFDYASGDENAGDDDVETFNQLFPTGHTYFGYIDQVGRQNIVSPHGTVMFDLPFGARGQLDGHYFWRAQDDDALYNASGTVVRAGNLGGSKDVGGELDLLIKRTLVRHLLVTIGYSHFFPGQFIEQSGPDEHIDFGYVAFEFTI
jgi:hypothetical protein